MAIYDKTTRDLMHEFASARLKKGEIFSKQDAASWFQQHYPKIKSNTVMLHVEEALPDKEYSLCIDTFLSLNE